MKRVALSKLSAVIKDLPSQNQADEVRRSFGLVGTDEAGNVVLPSGDHLDPVLTWAQLQAIPANVNLNRVVFVSDIGINGSRWVSNGVSWRPLAPIILAADHTARSVPNDTTTPTKLFSYIVPAGLLSNRSLLSFYPVLSYPGDTDAKNIRAFYGVGAVYSKTRNLATNLLEAPIIQLRTTGPSAQKYPFNGPATFASGSNATVATSAVPSDVDQEFYLDAGFSVAGDGSKLIWFHKATLVLEY